MHLHFYVLFDEMDWKILITTEHLDMYFKIVCVSESLVENVSYNVCFHGCFNHCMVVFKVWYETGSYCSIDR